MADDETGSEPLTSEQEARLRPQAKTFKAGSGHPTTAYVEVVRNVHESRVGRRHIEREFPNVSVGHVAHVLRKQAHEHGYEVAVAKTPEDGVCAMFAGRDALGVE